MVNFAIVWLCTITFTDAFAARGLPSPNPSISKPRTPLLQTLFPSRTGPPYHGAALCSSPAQTITTNDVTNRINSNDPSTTGVFPYGTVSMLTLLAIELVARATNSLNFAVSTRLLSVRFWSALTPFGAIAVRLAPIPTMVEIRRSGGVGGLPLLPYSAMLNLSFVLLVYGITKNDPRIMITYSIGLVMSLFYCVQYLCLCPENATHLPRTAQFHKQVSLGIVSFVLCSLTFLEKELASLIIGVTSVTLSCLMYISPLTRLCTAIRERSAKDIPLPFAVVGLVNTFAWVIHGFFAKRDFVLWLPCVVGVLSTSTQILLNVLWRERSGDEVSIQSR